MTNPVVHIENLSKSFSSKAGVLPVLKDISLSVVVGDFCAFTGVSGSGKTTLMNIIGLLDQPDHGDLWLNGTPTTHLDADQAAWMRNRIIGFVFQSFHLLPRLTALDNTMLPLLYRGVPRQKRFELASNVLARVGLADRLDHRPDELSGGQCQRVAIARALVGQPSLLLADEPTGNLDSQSAHEVMALLFELNRELNLTILMITHDPTIAARCPRQIAMRDGRIFDDNRGQLRGIEVCA